MTLEGRDVRPTTDKVKESVFSIIQFQIQGRVFLDLFAGSGQMGLEAVSRGAASAVLVDRSKDAVRVIGENVQKTKLGDACRVVQSDALDFLRRNRGRRFDIVFLDPPYAADLYTSSLKLLWENECLKPTSILVCESNFEDLLASEPTLAERFSIQKTVRYGKIVVTLLTPMLGATEE